MRVSVTVPVKGFELIRHAGYHDQRKSMYNLWVGRRRVWVWCNG